MEVAARRVDDRAQGAVAVQHAATRILALAMAFACCAAARADTADETGRSWMSVEGTLIDGSPSGFRVRYDGGVITVQMTGWDWYETYAPLDGSEVIVFGPVDERLFETGALEATSVYVDDLGTYFQREEGKGIADIASYVFYSDPIGNHVNLYGTVSGLKDGDIELELGGGAADVSVGTGPAGDNRLRETVLPKLEPGDRISVSGHLDPDFWQQRKLRADRIVIIAQPGKGTSSSG
jgi:hypothetical protein